MQKSLWDPANNLKTVALPQTHSSFVCTHDEVDCIACSAQKQDPSLRSLLREAIFVMQAAEYGSFTIRYPTGRLCLCGLGGTRSDAGSGGSGPSTECGLHGNGER